MKFPVTLTPDTEVGGYVVSFPDIPEALTQGDTKEEALQMGQEALESAMDFYFEDRRPVPTPSRPAPGQDTIALPADLAARVTRLNASLRHGARPTRPRGLHPLQNAAAGL